MSAEKSVDQQINELEELDVIEAKELSVGNAFHAFRFKKIAEDIDPNTQELMEKAAESLGMKLAEFENLVIEEANEANPIANFARGILLARSKDFK